VTILGASLSSKARDDFSDAPQGVFVVVVIFENDGAGAHQSVVGAQDVAIRRP
jgi:hypothetical protein